MSRADDDLYDISVDAVSEETVAKLSTDESGTVPGAVCFRGQCAVTPISVSNVFVQY